MSEANEDSEEEEEEVEEDKEEASSSAEILFPFLSTFSITPKSVNSNSPNVILDLESAEEMALLLPLSSTQLKSAAHCLLLFEVLLLVASSFRLFFVFALALDT